MSVRVRQAEAHEQTAKVFAFAQRDIAAVNLRHVAHDREPQAGARLSRIQSHAAIEDADAVRLWDTHAVVLNLDFDESGLRAGVFELLERKDVPIAVIVTEYVEIAKAFFEDEEPKLVNAVLDRIAKQVREPGRK